jgi:threonine/homoserine/homoserine lactone efflux protein
MFDIQNYLSFIAAVVVFQLIPGPGTLAILNATARGGVGAGIGAVLGTLAGDFVYMLAAVFGLAAVLAAYPQVLATAQWLGIAYLCWLGVRLLRAPVGGRPAAPGARRGGGVYFRQALAVSLTNPKVVMFFLAFFPLFLHPGSAPVTLVAMMLHVTGISFLYQAGLVLVGHAAARRLARWPHARRLATRLAGVALIGFGVRLALDTR